MNDMPLWEQLLIGALGLLVLFWFGPGIKASLAKSRAAEEKHWDSVLMLLALVIAFVAFLVWSVR
jgi:hypothetical protein